MVGAIGRVVKRGLGGVERLSNFARRRMTRSVGVRHSACDGCRKKAERVSCAVLRSVSGLFNYRPFVLFRSGVRAGGRVVTATFEVSGLKRGSLGRVTTFGSVMGSCLGVRHVTRGRTRWICRERTDLEISCKR